MFDLVCFYFVGGGDGILWVDFGYYYDVCLFVQFVFIWFFVYVFVCFFVFGWVEGFFFLCFVVGG